MGSGVNRPNTPHYQKLNAQILALGVLTGFSHFRPPSWGNHLVDHGVPCASLRLSGILILKQLIPRNGLPETPESMPITRAYILRRSHETVVDIETTIVNHHGNLGNGCEATAIRVGGTKGFFLLATGFSRLLRARYLPEPSKSPKMSLLPLPKVECGPGRRRKYPPDVVGTANVAFGHRLRDRGVCRILKERESIIDKIAQRDAQERKQYENFLNSWEFENETNRKRSLRAVRNRVEQGMQAYEEGVNARREKLRELITQEELELTREVVYQAQHGDDSRMEEMKEETERLRRQQEERRLEILAAKRMQQYIARCPEVRQELSRRHAKETKNCNLVQMAEKEAKRRAEKELEELWHELMLREVKAKEDREKEEAKKRCHQELDALTTLAKQVAGKLALEEEEKKTKQDEREYLENLWETVRKEETKKLEEEKKKREALRKELEEQATKAKEILAERAREEKRIDDTLNDLAKEELEKERAAIKETSAALRKELLAYLKYLEELREEEARRNLEVDRIIVESMKDARARKDLAVKRFREMRERNLREVISVREEQVRAKREKEEEERRSLEQEKILLEKEIETNAKLCALTREETRKNMIRYGKDLEEQKKYVEVLRKREKDEDERIYREGLKKEGEYRNLIEELLNASENVTPHPFKLLLREYEARFVAEKQGLYYCPPPLPPLLPSPLQPLASSSAK